MENSASETNYETITYKLHINKEEFAKEKIEDVFKNIKISKVSGIDDMSEGLTKEYLENSVEVMHTINKMCLEEAILGDCNLDILIKLLKKGDITKYKILRPIILSNK